MRWLFGVLILLALLANTALALAIWADLNVVNGNLFLMYQTCGSAGEGA